ELHARDQPAPRAHLAAAAPAGLALGVVVRRSHPSRFERVQEKMAELSARVQENLAGLRVVRAFGAEARELATFESLSEEYRRGHLGLIRISGVFQPSLAFWSGVGALLTIWIGGREVVAGHNPPGPVLAVSRPPRLLHLALVALC